MTPVAMCCLPLIRDSIVNEREQNREREREREREITDGEGDNRSERAVLT